MGLMRALLAATLIVGCSPSRTEVGLVTDTDLRVPEELDAIRVTVTGPDGEARVANAPLGADQPPLPRVLALVHDGGELGPFAVRVEGLQGSTLLVERRAVFSFQPGRVLVLRMDLLRNCVGVSCGAEETCGDAGCRPRQIQDDELVEWAGRPERDAGVPTVDAAPSGDAGECVDELCNGVDDDCDGAIDETFELSADPANCGSCGRACDAANGSAGCADGECTVEACDAGFDDCDGDPTNGCEADLTSPESCGECGTQCRPPEPQCCSGTCGRC